ncbi:FAA hydrolase family protein [Anaerobacillus alkaliphilus]|uniref:FAA hydrolase family protein n=1 Tax=Anaerobacillus alkaliphilus TaxID=1548597 RepID=A0A4Q0VQ86_9BACI|nr:fumarylacetoacetate hydrolase family protein [Anaerobacillus alkaliphilus]RXI96515.1 FAA hydrolase family protein [Anaerobacillus alkaliphilus]
MTEIKNIYCVGRNYALHAKELNNEVPTSPFLFSKPTHAAVYANGDDVMLPAGRGQIDYEVELVVKIGKPYYKGITIEEIIDQMAIGIDFTLRDVQSELKKKGHPWLLAKGFPNSALLSSFFLFPGEDACKQTTFSLLKNGVQVQRGSITDLIFDLQTIIDFTAEHFGLAERDIIFTGTPEGVGPVTSGDQFSLIWGEEVVGQSKVILK